MGSFQREAYTASASWHGVPGGGFVAGYRRVERGYGEELAPVLNRDAGANVLAHAQTPDLSEMLREKLASLAMPDEWIEDFVSNRRYVEYGAMDGQGGTRLVVEPRVDGLTDSTCEVEIPVRAGKRFLCYHDPTDPEHAASGCVGLHDGDYPMPEDRHLMGPSGRVVLPARSSSDKMDRSRKYELVQILKDTEVHQKYGFTVSDVQRYSRLVVVDPERAARAAQADIRAMGYSRVTVVTGIYSRTVVAAEKTLWKAAKHTPELPASIPADIVGDQVFIRHPAPGMGDWCVQGKTEHLRAALNFFRIAAQWGPQDALLMYPLETIKLGIEACYEDGSPVLGEVVPHMGDGTGLSPVEANFPLNLTAEALVDIQALHGSVLPVRLTSGGPVVASAVRVTGKHVALNAHVIQGNPEVFVGDDRAEPVHELARDLWVAEVHGEARPWPVREPVLGEEAVLVYSLGNSVEHIGPVVVESCRGDSITSSKAAGARPGVSGAALVALSDFSLLGVYCGQASTKLVYDKFRYETYYQIAELEQASVTSRGESSNDGGTVYTAFKNRGLASVIDENIRAAVPLYDGPVHVGMALAQRGRLITTVDPETAVGNLSVKGGPPLVWDADGSLYSAAMDTGSLAKPPVVRKVSPSDKVFVIGHDERGPYFSKMVSVKKVGLGAAHFSIDGLSEDALPLHGGLVVAKSDCAVVGLYEGPSLSLRLGATGACTAVPVLQEVKDKFDPVQFLEMKFPMLNPVAWPESALNAVFEHKTVNQSQAMEGYAAIGDAIAKAELYRKLLCDEVPTSLWQNRLQQLQMNKTLTDTAHRIGLAPKLRAGHGVTLQAGSKVYADMVEALVGVAAVNEERDKVVDLCEALGLLGTEANESLSRSSTNT